MLIDVVRKAMRVVSTSTDDEIYVYIEAAKADMLRLGIRKELIEDERTMHPMVQHAIMCYCTGSYGLENPYATQYLANYTRIVTSLVNSSLNETIYGITSQQVEETEPCEPETEENPYTRQSDIEGMYRYRGSVMAGELLPTEGLEVGDVWNIESDSQYGAAGANVAWNGVAWDTLGEVFKVPTMTDSEIDEIMGGDG